MTQQFKIKKQGGKFTAFDMVDPKRSYGSISIKTGKFVGDTRCMIALIEHLEEFKNADLQMKKGTMLRSKLRKIIKDNVTNYVNEIFATVQDTIGDVPGDIEPLLGLEASRVEQRLAKIIELQVTQALPDNFFIDDVKVPELDGITPEDDDY